MTDFELEELKKSKKTLIKKPPASFMKQDIGKFVLSISVSVAGKNL